jgi:flagellar motor switch protein FliN/FliY
MPTDLQSILNIEVPVIVQIASREMTLEEVTLLIPGSIIELPKLVDEELEILVANKPIGVGKAVKVGENFGIRVSYIGDVRERIAAMSGEDAEPPAEAGDGGEDSEQSPAEDAAVPSETASPMPS